jgi:CheY-like chemotaxis protein
MKARRHPGLSPLRLLVAHEDGAARRRLTATLRELPRFAEAIVETAEDGAGALDLLRQKRYDLVLIAADLPRISGVDLLRRVRVDHFDFETPVVLVGASAPHIRKAAADVRAAYVMDEPSRAQLGRAVLRVLERKAAMDTAHTEADTTPRKVSTKSTRHGAAKR